MEGRELVSEPENGAKAGAGFSSLLFGYPTHQIQGEAVANVAQVTAFAEIRNSRRVGKGLLGKHAQNWYG